MARIDGRESAPRGVWSAPSEWQWPPPAIWRFSFLTPPLCSVGLRTVALGPFPTAPDSLECAPDSARCSKCLGLPPLVLGLPPSVRCLLTCRPRVRALHPAPTPIDPSRSSPDPRPCTDTHRRPHPNPPPSFSCVGSATTIAARRCETAGDALDARPQQESRRPQTADQQGRTTLDTRRPTRTAHEAGTTDHGRPSGASTNYRRRRSETAGQTGKGRSGKPRTTVVSTYSEKRRYRVFRIGGGGSAGVLYISGREPPPP